MELFFFSPLFWLLKTFANHEAERSIFQILFILSLGIMAIVWAIFRKSGPSQKQPNATNVQPNAVHPAGQVSTWNIPPTVFTHTWTPPPIPDPAQPISNQTLPQMLAAHLRANPSQAQMLVEQLAKEIRRYEQETHVHLSLNTVEHTFNEISQPLESPDASSNTSTSDTASSDEDFDTVDSPLGTMVSEAVSACEPSFQTSTPTVVEIPAPFFSTSKSSATIHTSTPGAPPESMVYPSTADHSTPRGNGSRRTWSELFSEFLEVRNIRWGEIIGGLLIVGCSIALIVSLHEQLDRIPHSEFWMFSGLVLLLYTIGMYSNTRWKLPHASIGFLSTATLLVSLCFTGIIQHDALTVPQTLAEFGTLSIFSIFLYTSSKRLVAKAPNRWLVSMGLLWGFLFINQYFRFGTSEGENPFVAMGIHTIIYFILIPGLITWFGIVSILRKDCHCVPRQRMLKHHVDLYSEAFLYRLFPSLRWNDMEEFVSFLRGAALLLFSGAVACTAFALPIYRKAHITFSEFPQTLPPVFWMLLILLLSYLGMQILNMRAVRVFAKNTREKAGGNSAISLDSCESVRTSDETETALPNVFYPLTQLIGHFLLVIACAAALFFMVISRDTPAWFAFFGITQTALLCVAANRWKRWISVHWTAIFFSVLSSFAIIAVSRGEPLSVDILLNQRIGMELLGLFAFYLLMSRWFSRKAILIHSARLKPSRFWLIAALSTAIVSLAQVAILDGYYLYRGKEDFVQYTLITLSVYALSSFFVAIKNKRPIFALIGFSLIVFLPMRGLLHEGTNYFLVNLPSMLAGMAFAGILSDIFIRSYISKKPSIRDHQTIDREQISRTDAHLDTWINVFNPSLMRLIYTLLGCAIPAMLVCIGGGFFHTKFEATWIEFLKMYILFGFCGISLQNRLFKMLGQWCAIGAVIYLVNVYANRMLGLSIECYYVVQDPRVGSYLVLALTLLMLYWATLRICVKYLPALINGQSPRLATCLVQFRHFSRIPELGAIPWHHRLTLSSVSKWPIFGAFDRYFSWLVMGLFFIFVASDVSRFFLTHSFGFPVSDSFPSPLALRDFGGVTAHAAGLLPWTWGWLGMMSICILWMWDHWRTTEKIVLLLVVAIGGILGLCWLDRISLLHNHLLLLQLSACWIAAFLYSMILLCIGFRSLIQKYLIRLSCDLFAQDPICASSEAVLGAGYDHPGQIFAAPSRRKRNGLPRLFDGISFAIFALPLLGLVLCGLDHTSAYFGNYFWMILSSIGIVIPILSWRAMRDRTVGFLGLASIFLLVITCSAVRYRYCHHEEIMTLLFWARMTQATTIIASVWTSSWCIWLYQKSKKMSKRSENPNREQIGGYFDRSYFRRYTQILQQSTLWLWATLVVGSAVCYLAFPALERLKDAAGLVPTGSFAITWSTFLISAIGYFIWDYTTQNCLADSENAKFKWSVFKAPIAILWVWTSIFIVFLCAVTAADWSFQNGYPTLLATGGVAALTLSTVCARWKYIHLPDSCEKVLLTTFARVKQQQILTRGTIGIGFCVLGLMALWLLFWHPATPQHVEFPYGTGALTCGVFALSMLILLIVQNQSWIRFLFLVFWMSGLWISVPLRFGTRSIWTFNESIFSYLWIGFAIAMCIDALGQTLYDRWTKTLRSDKRTELITSFDLALIIGCIPIFFNFVTYIPWNYHFGWETWIGYLWIAFGLTIRIWNRRASGTGRLWWTFGLIVLSFALSLANAKENVDLWILIAASVSMYLLLGAAISHIVRKVRHCVRTPKKTNVWVIWNLSEFLIAQYVLLWIVTPIVMVLLLGMPLEKSFSIGSDENILYSLCTRRILVSLTVIFVIAGSTMTAALIADHRQRTWKKLTVLYSMLWIVSFFSLPTRTLSIQWTLRLLTVWIISIWAGYFAWRTMIWIYMRTYHVFQPKSQRKFKKTWTNTLRTMLPTFKIVTIWAVSLALLFEVCGYSSVVQRFSWTVIHSRGFEILYARPLDIIAFSLALVFSIGLLIRRAITISRQPDGDHDEQIKSGHKYIWYAETVFAILVCHIYITMPFLFGHGFFEKYGIFAVLTIAFAGTLMSEVFQRMRLDVLCKPLSDTAYVMPMFMAIVQWFMGQNTATAWCCISIYYLFVAMTQRKTAAWFLTTVSFLFAFWTALHQWNIQFMGHIQVWMIPPAIAALIAQWFERNQLTQLQNTAIRWFSLAAIYGSSTTDMFLVGLSSGVTRPLALMLLSIAAIFVGMLTRMRSILYLGVVFLSIDLLAMIKYAAVDLQQTWILWCSGIALGGAILILFAILEKRGKLKKNHEQDPK